MGEIGRRSSERIIDHSGGDDNCENVKTDHFEILSSVYKNNKLAEALHIKHERPILNVQEQSVSLKLFNLQSTEA